jgi:hypothetical protein
MGFGLVEVLLNLIAAFLKFVYLKYFLNKNLTFKKVRNSKAIDSGMNDVLAIFTLILLLYFLTFIKC